MSAGKIAGKVVDLLKNPYKIGVVPIHPWILQGKFFRVGRVNLL